MTVPAERVRRRPTLTGRVLSLLLVVALLAPVAFLFAQQRLLTDDDRALAVRERLGVEYLRALGPVTLALVDAQSAAVAGRTDSRDALNRAVEDAASVDTRLGKQLRTHDRWTGLRAKLEALPDRALTDPAAAFVAYGEVTDLLLALHRKVREGSGLIRDPRPDTFYLQDAISEELPESLVATGRLADLAGIAARAPAAERINMTAELGALWTGAISPANDLVTNLRAAVDSTESNKLGASVITPLDTYQRAIERLDVLGTPTDASELGQEAATRRNLAALAAVRTDVQVTAKQLQPVILDELDALLRDRIDQLDRARWLAVAAAGAAVLLVAALGAVLLAAFRRARQRAAAEQRAGGNTGASPGDADWEPPADPRGLAPLGTLPPAEPRTLQPAGQGRAAGAERWGHFDAR
ncbi:hypothetical protein [Micromonospora sp. RTGN7]|uniref:hypothetical protein n=1 Tax=Micromonospora sp. RTGN7 TaxID=3016526 RepID=UPI0029FF2EC7|nr:hypothetical protein [Micromonospora sp. RTGN7]